MRQVTSTAFLYMAPVIVLTTEFIISRCGSRSSTAAVSSQLKITLLGQNLNPTRFNTFKSFPGGSS